MKYNYLIYNTEHLFGCTIHNIVCKTNDYNVLINTIANTNYCYLTCKTDSNYLHIIEYQNNTNNVYTTMDGDVSHLDLVLLNNDNGYKIYYNDKLKLTHTVIDI